eukprot:4655518-Prymnesium_polylepis.1
MSFLGARGPTVAAGATAERRGCIGASAPHALAVPCARAAADTLWSRVVRARSMICNRTAMCGGRLTWSSPR